MARHRTRLQVSVRIEFLCPTDQTRLTRPLLVLPPIRKRQLFRLMLLELDDNGGRRPESGKRRCHDLQPTRSPAVSSQRRHHAPTIARTASFFSWPRELDHLKIDISVQRPGCALTAALTSLDSQVDNNCPLIGTVHSEALLQTRIGGARESTTDTHKNQGGQESHVNRMHAPRLHVT